MEHFKNVKLVLVTIKLCRVVDGGGCEIEQVTIENQYRKGAALNPTKHLGGPVLCKKVVHAWQQLLFCCPHLMVEQIREIMRTSHGGQGFREGCTKMVHVKIPHTRASRERKGFGVASRRLEKSQALFSSPFFFKLQQKLNILKGFYRPPTNNK
ncbi:unnamed protein product [Ectocarpus sp. 12 AP-2014]